MNTILIAAFSLLCFFPLSGQSADEPSVLVRTEPLKRHRLTETLVGYGTIAPEPGHTISVSTLRAGKLIALRTGMGQVVRRGDALFEIQTDPSGQLIFRQTETAVDFARAELERMKELAAQQLATRSQVAAAQKVLDDAEAQLAAQRKVGTNMSVETIKAPVSGVITGITAAPGDGIVAGAAVLKIALIEQLAAQIGVEPDEALRVKPGMKVLIKSVFNERNAIDGRVLRVQGMINPQTQLVGVIVEFSGNGATRLLPGMRVNAEIVVATQETWTVPRQAVLDDTKGAYVYQVKNGRAHRVGIVRGLKSGERLGVNGPLDPALPVVVSGNYGLQDGMRVREAPR